MEVLMSTYTIAKTAIPNGLDASSRAHLKKGMDLAPGRAPI